MRQRRPNVCDGIRLMTLALLVPPGSMAAADLCDAPTVQPFSLSEPAAAIEEGQRRCYSSDFHTAGVWIVSASVDATEEPAPALWISNEPCDRDQEAAGPATQVLYRTENDAVLRVFSPGRYLFCISPQDPRRALGEHRVIHLFSPENGPSDPDEDEPDPAPRSATSRDDTANLVFVLRRLAAACSQVKSDDLAARALAWP